MENTNKFQSRRKETTGQDVESRHHQTSESDWASAPVLVRKKDGSGRWCIDYRALNDRTIKDQYPQPLIDDCQDNLAGTVYFGDLASEYYQIEIEESSMNKTAMMKQQRNLMVLIIMLLKHLLPLLQNIKGRGGGKKCYLWFPRYSLR